MEQYLRLIKLSYLVSGLIFLVNLINCQQLQEPAVDPKTVEWKNLTIENSFKNLDLGTPDLSFIVKYASSSCREKIRKMCSLQLELYDSGLKTLENYKTDPSKAKLIAHENDFYVISPTSEGFLLSSFFFFDFTWLKKINLLNPKWALKSFDDQKGFVGKKLIFAYTETKICSLLLPDADEEEDEPEDYVWKVPQPCSPIEFTPINKDEIIVKVQSIKNSTKMYLATDQRIYDLTDNYKKMTLLSYKEVSLNISSIHFITEKRVFFINEDQYAVRLQELDPNSESLLNLTLILNDPLDSPFLLETNGEFIVLRELSPYTNSYIYNVANSSLPFEKREDWYQISQNSSYNTGLSHNNTIILYGKNNYLIYKTDLEGFIKTENKIEENLMGVIYDNEEGRNSLIKILMHQKTGNIIRKREIIEKLSLKCGPRSELLTLLKHETRALFLTFLKKNDIPSGFGDGPSETKYNHIGHKLVWINKINGFGISAWALMAIFFISALVLIYQGFMNGRKEDQELEHAQQKWIERSQNGSEYEKKDKKKKRHFRDVFNKLQIGNGDEEDEFSSNEVYYSFVQSNSILEEEMLNTTKKKKRYRSTTEESQESPSTSHSYILRKKASTQN